VSDDQIGSLLLESPQVLGVEDLAEGQIQLRLMVRTMANEHWAVQRRIRQLVFAAFRERGISLATPKREIILRGQPQSFEDS
ncbi:MAG: hypothetical protein R3300_20335, partial [Candidatus Promineifilaceae bacterium]|nr:hypothetical protein [Candidatus Promineifilaceae bacterium]